MPEVQDAVTVGGAYKESDDHVPSPTDVYGTLDTSATAGAADSRIETVTPIHEVAKAQDAIVAAKALDPDDDSVDSSLVVLPQGMIISESGEGEAKERVSSLGQKASESPVEIGGLSPFQKQAAEGGDEGAETAEAQQESAGAGNGSASTDTARQTNQSTGGVQSAPAKAGNDTTKASKASGTS